MGLFSPNKGWADDLDPKWNTLKSAENQAFLSDDEEERLNNLEGEKLEEELEQKEEELENLESEIEELEEEIDDFDSEIADEESEIEGWAGDRESEGLIMDAIYRQ
jgi:predicted  nucleic acid-binding Zn-ribbon protein